MVSPEMLRRYPFFVDMDDAWIKAIAMISDEVSTKPGDVLYETGTPSDKLFLLMEGNVEIYLQIKDSGDPTFQKEFYVDDINPGEAFGLSSLGETHNHSSSTKVSRAGKVLRIDASGLSELCDANPLLGYKMMKQFAKTALERLELTRVLLAAARGAA